MTEFKRVIYSDYQEWLVNWYKDMIKYYSDKRRVVKRRFE